MSEWKKDRAEAAMREFDKENMTKAAQKRKEKELAEKWDKVRGELTDGWDEIKQNLYVGDSEDDKNIDWIIDLLKKSYNLPTLKKS